MKVRVYRNLDRPFAMLGIKGKFIGVAGALAVLCVIVSIVIGTIAGTFIGLAFCAVALVLAYLLVSELHEKIRTYSMQAGEQVKKYGNENNLVDLIAADPAFGMTKEEIVAILQPINFVGRRFETGKS